jgi:hypothetical protein
MTGKATQIDVALMVGRRKIVGLHDTKLIGMGEVPRKTALRFSALYLEP